MGKLTKYRNIPYKGFHSKKEYDRYLELKLLERAGEITDLECQPKWELLPSFTDHWDGKHRAVTYTADFRYIDKNSIEIVEDVKAVKSLRTEVYKIKKKLLLFQYHDFVFKEIY